MKEQLTNEEIRDFCLRMPMFLNGGIDMTEGLALLAEEEAESDLGVTFRDMMKVADRGKPLSACVRESGRFPSYVAGMLQAGEKTGRTEEALNAISDYFENRLYTERRLRTALLHPAVLMIIMMAVIVVLLTKVLPVFDQVYRQLGSRFSGAAGGFLLFGQALEKCLPVFCIIAGAAAVFLFLFFSNFKFREAMERVWKRHFGERGIFGAASRVAAVQVISMSMGSGFPVAEALMIAEVFLRDVPAVRKSCRICAEEMEKGVPLAQAAWQSGLLSRTDSRMLSAGIRSGSGDKAIYEIAERMREESDAAMEETVGRIEPAMVLALPVLE